MKISENQSNGVDNEIVAKINPTKNRGFWQNLRKYLTEYTEVTGIQGLRYLTEKRSRVEKIVWAFLLLMSLAGCLYMIYEILDKYENRPVVVSFATKDTPLHQISFPAITVCPETKYSREEFNFSKVLMQLSRGEEVDETELKLFNYVNLLCDENDKENVTSRTNKTVDDGFFQAIDKLKPSLEPNPDNMVEFCSSGICETVTPVITDEGICYSYNILDRSEVFREHVFNYAEYFHVDNRSDNVFDIEAGYKKGAGINTYPRRALTSGADNALFIFLNDNANNTDFACKSLFQGFRVLIHNPWDVPRLSRHFFRIPFRKIVVAAMEAEVVVTSNAVKKFNPEKRQCFMKDERPLKHFKYYTQPNCLLECVTNYTLSKCGCVRFFMPRDNKTAICGSGSSDCTEEVELEMKVKELESRISGHKFCDCKPSCTNIKFQVETSQSDFYFKEYFETRGERKLGNDNSQTSILQIYFKNEQFLTMERNELYGVSDLISNLGGLLGLFTGFSLISLVEIIYFCSLRIFYNEKIYGRWSGSPN